MKLKQLSVFLCIVFLSNTFALSIYSTGDSLFTKGAFQEAAYQFEWEIFNCKTDSAKNQLLLKKAYCYKQLAQYENSLVNLNRINTETLNKELKPVVIYEKLFCFYILGNARACIQEYSQFENELNDTTKQLILPFKILALCDLGEVSMCKATFLYYLEQTNQSLKAENALNLFSTIRFKNSRKAKLLSSLFPGLGQMYVSQFNKGLGSMLLVGLVSTYTVLSLIHGYYLSSLFTGLGCSMRFYTGGIKSALQLTDEYNHNQLLLLRNELLHFFSSVQPMQNDKN